MARFNPHRSAQTRRLLAETAARIMVEEDLTHFGRACQKAAQRLGVSNTRQWPEAAEIEQALIDYRQLFQADSHADSLEQQRRTALQAMRFLHAFQPLLTGSILRGSAGPESAIVLHLFADEPERVALTLSDDGIPFDPDEQQLLFDRDEVVRCPGFRFLAGDQRIQLLVLPLKEQRRRPLSPLDKRPMQRAGIRDLEALLEG